jgi:hypothetical protein
MDDLSQQGLAVNFSPRDLPGDTAFIRYYVLRSNLQAGGTINCETFFVGPDRKRVSEYANDIIDTRTIEFSQTDGGVVVIKDLNEETYVFYVEALASNYDILTCGCGEAEIEKGKKSNIRIYLVDDCL